MDGDFNDRIDELAALWGDGEDLTGTVEFDQVYAQYQHEGLELRHPRGGQAKYLETVVFAKAEATMQKVADSFLHDGGVEGMSDAMEVVADEAEKLAPVEFHDLRDSAHPVVRDGDVVVYDRPPVVPRLTKEQLKAKDRLRSLGFGHRGDA